MKKIYIQPTIEMAQIDIDLSVLTGSDSHYTAPQTDTKEYDSTPSSYDDSWTIL